MYWIYIANNICQLFNGKKIIIFNQNNYIKYFISIYELPNGKRNIGKFELPNENCQMGNNQMGIEKLEFQNGKIVKWSQSLILFKKNNQLNLTYIYLNY